jgi:hypothetical protein
MELKRKESLPGPGPGPGIGIGIKSIKSTVLDVTYDPYY